MAGVKQRAVLAMQDQVPTNGHHGQNDKEEHEGKQDAKERSDQIQAQ